jgi:hypothetical protein
VSLSERRDAETGRQRIARAVLSLSARRGPAGVVGWNRERPGGALGRDDDYDGGGGRRGELLGVLGLLGPMHARIHGRQAADEQAPCACSPVAQATTKKQKAERAKRWLVWAYVGVWVSVWVCLCGCACVCALTMCAYYGTMANACPSMIATAWMIKGTLADHKRENGSARV